MAKSRRKLHRPESDAVSVVGYIRVSTDKQADSGAGLESQRQAIEDEVGRRGWTVSSMVTDEGLSAKDLNRPGLQEALELLSRGKANALVAAKLDRLSRSVGDFCQLVDLASRQGWKLVVLDVNVDTSTPVGEMVANVLVSFAQFERRLIGQRTKEALRVKREQGIVGGRRVSVDKVTARLIQVLRSRGMTYAQIADHLNLAGKATPMNGKKWYPASVRQIVVRLDRHTEKVPVVRPVNFGGFPAPTNVTRYSSR